MASLHSFRLLLQQTGSRSSSSSLCRLSCFLIVLFSLANLVVSSPLSLESLISTGDASVGKCGMEHDCSLALSVEEESQPGLEPDGRERPRSDWSSLGLNSDNLHVNRIAVGFAPGFKESKAPNTPAEINQHLPKPMAIVGDYFPLTWDSLDMKDLKYHMSTIANLKGSPVWCIALMPEIGLDSITWRVAQRIALKMKEINSQGITVWLRFGHEMNGDWYTWGMRPQKFIQKWKLVSKMVKSITDRTYMLWSPNAMFGNSINDLHGGYTPYWPGGDSVDIVGLSFYHWGDAAKRVNIAPTPNEVVRKLHDFSNLYGPGGWGKPVVISETAASYTYNRDTQSPVGGGASEFTIKLTWLHLLLDRYIKETIPGLRAMVWFEVIKDENATGNTAVHTEDFRLILGNPKLRVAAHAFFQNLQQE